MAPVTRNIRFEGLAEDWVELHNVLLKAHDITIKCEHVVDTLVFEILDVDGLVLG